VSAEIVTNKFYNILGNFSERMVTSSLAMENKLAIHVNLLRSWSSSGAYIGP
jgi:hypothetical protein